MTLLRIEPLQPADRAEVVHMLAEDRDLPRSVAESYARANTWDQDWVLKTGDRIDGVLTGTFGLDRHGDHYFGALNPPEGPHAILHRVFIRVSERSNGLGQHLIHMFAEEAHAHGTTFILGSLDRNGDLHARRKFFDGIGFRLGPNDTFGAPPGQVLDTIESRHT